MGASSRVRSTQVLSGRSTGLVQGRLSFQPDSLTGLQLDQRQLRLYGTDERQVWGCRGIRSSGSSVRVIRRRRSLSYNGYDATPAKHQCDHTLPNPAPSHTKLAPCLPVPVVVWLERITKVCVGLSAVAYLFNQIWRWRKPCTEAPGIRLQLMQRSFVNATEFANAQFHAAVALEGLLNSVSYGPRCLT